MVELLTASRRYFYGADGVKDKRPPSSILHAVQSIRVALGRDNGKCSLNPWRQEVFLGLEAAENVTKI